MAIIRHSSFTGASISSETERLVVDALDVTAKAVIDNRFDLFLSRYMIPHVLENLDAVQVYRTQDELLAFFSSGVRFYRGLGATELDRVIVAVELLADGSVNLATEGRARRGTTLLQDTYPTLLTLLPEDGVLKFAKSSYGLRSDADFFDGLS